jgi:hypothetical protein
VLDKWQSSAVSKVAILGDVPKPVAVHGMTVNKISVNDGAGDLVAAARPISRRDSECRFDLGESRKIAALLVAATHRDETVDECKHKVWWPGGLLLAAHRSKEVGGESVDIDPGGA